MKHFIVTVFFGSASKDFHVVANASFNVLTKLREQREFKEFAYFNGREAMTIGVRRA